MLFSWDWCMLQPKTKIMCDIGFLTEKNVEQLRILNRVVFPVTYTEKFYDSLLAKGNSDWTQLGKPHGPHPDHIFWLASK